MTPQVISKYESGARQSVPVCCPHPRGGGGGERVRGSGNNSAAAVAHPPSQCTQRKTLAYNNTNVCAVAHPHSTLIMIHTKLHKYLPTSAQELQPNTNTEPKHIVESLSFSPRPDFVCVVKPASAASQLCFVFSIPPLHFFAIKDHIQREKKAAALGGGILWFVFDKMCFHLLNSVSWP